MFFRRSIFFVLFALLLVLGLSGLRQRSEYAEGYAEGYAAAQQADGRAAGESAAESSGAPRSSAETPPPYPVGRGWGWGLFGLLGLFLKFWLILLLFGFFMKLLFFRRFRGWHRGHWHGPWHGGHKRPREKQPEDVEPDIQYT